jgi:hypothetical protein
MKRLLCSFFLTAICLSYVIGCGARDNEDYKPDRSQEEKAPKRGPDSGPRKIRP